MTDVEPTEVKPAEMIPLDSAAIGSDRTNAIRPAECKRSLWRVQNAPVACQWLNQCIISTWVTAYFRSYRHRLSATETDMCRPFPHKNTTCNGTMQLITEAAQGTTGDTQNRSAW